MKDRPRGVVSSNRKPLDIALGQASLDGDIEYCVALLARGCNPNVLLLKGNTALILAAVAGRKDCIVALLEAGADPLVVNDAGETALLLSTLSNMGAGGFSGVGPLVAAGSNVDHAGPRKRRPLHEVAWREDAQALETLLGAGADPNVQDEDGATPLMEAASSGMARNVVLLLSCGARLNDVDHRGATAEKRAKSDALFALVAAREKAELREASASGLEASATVNLAGLRTRRNPAL